MIGNVEKKLYHPKKLFFFIPNLNIDDSLLDWQTLWVALQNEKPDILGEQVFPVPDSGDFDFIYLGNQIW